MIKQGGAKAPNPCYFTTQKQILSMKLQTITFIIAVTGLILSIYNFANIIIGGEINNEQDISSSKISLQFQNLQTIQRPNQAGIIRANRQLLQGT
jgi:lipid A disaccharide synthetase